VAAGEAVVVAVAAAAAVGPEVRRVVVDLMVAMAASTRLAPWERWDRNLAGMYSVQCGTLHRWQGL
jgi:hypothetical protein